MKHLTLWLLLIAASSACAADFERIDVHVHILQYPPEYRQLLDELRMRAVNISVVDRSALGPQTVEAQNRMVRQVLKASNGRLAWCSTFDPRGWQKPGFAAETIALLGETFRQGAIAVKIWKDIGMDIRSATGAYLMADDPALRPIYQYLARENKTLCAHLAEPDAAWRPLDPAAPHYGYYKDHPRWHMFQHPEAPRKAAILAARDRVLEQNPELRMVGCHLGSMEEDLDAIALRLDRYPNFAVDTTARINDLMRQPREKVRAFLIRYQDRVLYGTDTGLALDADLKQRVARMREVYARDWKYFATAEEIDVQGLRVQGLALPPEVLRKLYRENALRWFPGFKRP
jgi:hypothetical protein